MPLALRFPHTSTTVRPLRQCGGTARLEAQREAEREARMWPGCADVDLTDAESAWLHELEYLGAALLREEQTRLALGTTPMSMAEREALLLRLRQAALSHAPRWRYL